MLTDRASLPAMAVGTRLTTLAGRLDELGVDALLVSNLTNIRYLTGFTGSAGQLLVSAEGALLLTDGRYRQQAESQLTDAGVADVVETSIGGPSIQDESIASRVRGVAHLGVEADDLSWARARQLDDVVGDTDLIALTDTVTAQRSRKDAGEVARISAAATIADAALAHCVDALSSGVSELGFARMLDHRMLTTGAEALSFETICAAGPNSALPHARPSDRVIANGDLVVVDFGAVVDGYHSDMTRTFVIGQPDDETAEMLEVVRAAQQQGFEQVAAGTSCADVDDACRSAIAAAGMGDEFVHGTGHGVGLVIHEAPWVNGSSATVLEPGHVVTVEPGVYRPGFGGVRVEDTVLVAESGAERLTHAPKEPVLGPVPS